MEHLGSVAFRVYFIEIIFIQCYDGTFHTVYLFKIIGVKVGSHSLRHTADKHIQAEITHQLTVRGITQRSPVVETALEQIYRCGISQCPLELFIIHRIHVKFDFLAWDKNILDVLAD